MKDKTCKTCGQEKPLTEFYAHPTCKDGHLSRCKTCIKESYKARYKERGKATPPHAVLYYNAKGRAARKGIPFSLSKDDLEKRLGGGKCEVSGLPFGPVGSPWAPSLARVDPSGGYTPENTKIVVWIYNAAKLDFSHEDVMKLAGALVHGN